MSDARFVWDGMKELKADLRRLPAALTAEGAGIVRTGAHNAANAIRNKYPTGPGQSRRRKRPGALKRGVTVEEQGGGRFGAHVIVWSRAPHAHLYEWGTDPRETRRGANRGAMTAHDIFVPEMVRRRTQMMLELTYLLVRHGLTVTYP